MAVSLFNKDAALCAEADGLLTGTGLTDLLSRSGMVHVSGSYALRLTTWRDLDISLRHRDNGVSVLCLGQRPGSPGTSTVCGRPWPSWRSTSLAPGRVVDRFQTVWGFLNLDKVHMVRDAQQFGLSGQNRCLGFQGAQTNHAAKLKVWLHGNHFFGFRPTSSKTPTM